MLINKQQSKRNSLYQKPKLNKTKKIQYLNPKSATKMQYRYQKLIRQHKKIH